MPEECLAHSWPRGASSLSAGGDNWDAGVPHLGHGADVPRRVRPETPDIEALLLTGDEGIWVPCTLWL